METSAIKVSGTLSNGEYESATEHYVKLTNIYNLALQRYNGLPSSIQQQIGEVPEPPHVPVLTTLDNVHDVIVEEEQRCQEFNKWLGGVMLHVSLEQQ